MSDTDFFTAYILKLKDACPLADESSGHAIASMLIGHRMGLYDRAVSQGDKAVRLLNELESVPETLVRAVMIVKSDAQRNIPRQVTIKSSFDWEGKDPSHDDSRRSTGDDNEYEFDERSYPWLALVLPDEKEDIRDIYMLDMALMLLYGIAVCSSPMDEQAMEEHLYDYLIHRLGIYRD